MHLEIWRLPTPHLFKSTKTSRPNSARVSGHLGFSTNTEISFANQIEDNKQQVVIVSGLYVVTWRSWRLTSQMFLWITTRSNVLLTDSCWMFIRQLTHYRGYYTTNPNNACWRANLPKWPYTFTVCYPPNMGPMKWRLVIFPHVPRFPRSARDKSKSRPFVDHFHATIKPAITQPAERQKANYHKNFQLSQITC